MSTIPLADSIHKNQIDIWCAPVPDEWDSRILKSYSEILSPEEIKRYNGYAFDKDRRQFLLTRALERDVLSRYLGVNPSDLVFARNEYGKPAVAEPVGASITYSLSHTKGISVCAVASTGCIGVDVENPQRSASFREIAQRYFATSEAVYLDSVDECRKQAEFYKLWTLKEAFIKARGLGFFIPLNSFEIQFFSDRPPSVSSRDDIHGLTEDWQFLQFRVGGKFQVAVASHRLCVKPLAVKLSMITPLSGESGGNMLQPNAINEWEIGKA